MRKQIGLKFEESDIERWDAWAEAHELTRTQAIEAGMAALLEGRVIAARQESPPSGRPRLDSYPSMPSDSTKVGRDNPHDNERRRAMDARNAAIQRAALAAPAGGTFGAGKPPS